MIYNELRAGAHDNNPASANIMETSEEKIKKGLVKEAQINNNYESCCQSEVSFMFQKNVKKVNEFINSNLNDNIELILKDDAFDKNLQSADLVTGDATRTSCFTKK